MFATSSIRIIFHSRVTSAIQRLPPLALWLLFTSALYPKLSGGLAWAAITGVGLAVPSTALQIQRGTFGTIQPIRTIERTNRDCDLNALARVMDDTYCDKYYVCSDGKYVGLFCPVGMAFDYGLQECHLKQKVDCSKRPLFFADSLSSATGGINPLPQTTTATPSRTTSPPTTSPAPPSVSLTGQVAGSTLAPVPSTGQVAGPSLVPPISPPGQMTGSTMVLPFGGRVTIPFGSTIFLPPGSQIQMEQQQPLPVAPGISGSQIQIQQQQPLPAALAHHHHEHSSGSTSSDAVGVMNTTGNTESQSAIGNTDFDYYFYDDEPTDSATTTAPMGGQ